MSDKYELMYTDGDSLYERSFESEKEALEIAKNLRSRGFAVRVDAPNTEVPVYWEV